MSAPKSKKVSATRVQTSIRARFNPIKGLTPEKLGTTLDALDRGELRNFALTADKVRRRDLQIGAVVGKRERAVALLDYEILTTEDSPAAQAQQAALKFLYDNLRAGSAVDGNQSGGFSLLVAQMMRSVGEKYAVHELIWKPQASTADGPRLKVEAIHVPLWFFENSSGSLRFLESDYAIYGRELEADGWLVSVGPGLMEASLVAYIFKNLSLKDWVYYSEKFGLPGLHGKTDATDGTKEWDRFVEAVKEFGNDFAIVTNMSGEIKELAFGSKGELPFPKLIEYMDRALSILWRGGDLSTMSAGNAVGSNPQDEEKDDIAEADALTISETLNEQIDRPAIRYLFGVDEPLAYISIKPKARPNVTTEIATDQFLIGAGVAIAQDDLAARYGRTAAAPGKPLARVAQTAAPAPFGGANAAYRTADLARAALFREGALRKLSPAQRSALHPLLQRIAVVLDLPDTEFDAGLAKLKAELPALAKQILSSDAVGELAKAWESILGPALVSGAASAAQKQSAAK
jgi:phage gp29-like protein